MVGAAQAVGLVMVLLVVVTARVAEHRSQSPCGPHRRVLTRPELGLQLRSSAQHVPLSLAPLFLSRWLQTEVEAAAAAVAQAQVAAEGCFPALGLGDPGAEEGTLVPYAL